MYIHRVTVYSVLYLKTKYVEYMFVPNNHTDRNNNPKWQKIACALKDLEYFLIKIFTKTFIGLQVNSNLVDEKAFRVQTTFYQTNRKLKLKNNSCPPWGFIRRQVQTIEGVERCYLSFKKFHVFLFSKTDKCYVFF